MKTLSIVKNLGMIIVSAVNYFFFFNRALKSIKSKYIFVRIFTHQNNCIHFYYSFFKRSLINIQGKNNILNVNNSTIYSSNFNIKGNNNSISLEKGVILRNATIHIRGNNCSLKIGTGTSFGQVRIVNVGMNNSITIGANCLFADNIEIWASDTHSIYDSAGNFINPEKPIEINNNVWIGSYVKILKGVKIGDGAIIGMNSLVTKDVFPKTLNAGNPMRCLKNGVYWTLEYQNENVSVANKNSFL